MFTSVSIQNFRCFKDLTINSFNRINLIAGKNNVGKTALLEAVFLLADGSNLLRTVTLANFRGVHKLNRSSGSELVFSPLFRQFSTENTIKISGLLNTGERHTTELWLTSGDTIPLDTSDELITDIEATTRDLPSHVLQSKYTSPSGESYSSQMWIEYQNIRIETKAPNSPFPVYFLIANARQAAEQDAELFGRLEVVRESYNLLESLKVVEPRLERLSTIVIAGTPVLHGDVGLNRMLPLSLMGEGLRRLTSILLAIANASGGIVLIDELENGFHHSVLKKVWQAIGDAARRSNTQVFATTHSYECIQAAHQVFAEDNGYDFRLHRLDRFDEQIKAVTYEQETLEAATKAELEVR